MEPAFSAALLADWLGPLLWGLVAFCVLSYFVGSYLFEVLAQKLDEPRWMAWVPIANLYLALRLLGWGHLFWLLLGGYGLGLLGVFLPAPLSILAALAIVPTALAVIVIGFVYWPLLARRRDLPLWVGLLLVLPQLVLVPLEFVLSETALFAASLAVAAVGFAAFLWIVFHDGGPEQPPHPIGYALTGLGAVVGAALALQLPVWLEDSGTLAQMQTGWVAAAGQGGEGRVAPEVEELAALWAGFTGREPEEALAHARGEGPSPPTRAAAEPDPHAVPDVCPPGHREAGARPPGGREWWCEIETSQGWVRHGPSRRWRHARAVEEEGEYRYGLRHGTWTRYWGTGGRHTQAEFRDGKQDGWMHRWDEAGRLERVTRFEDGEPAPLANPGV